MNGADLPLVRLLRQRRERERIPQTFVPMVSEKEWPLSVPLISASMRTEEEEEHDDEGILVENDSQRQLIVFSLA